MPRKRITFIVIPPNDGQVREYKFAARILWIGGLMAVALVAALGYYSVHFHTRVDQRALLSELRLENDQLVTGLDQSRRELADLEGLMAVLADDDQKLRYWHQMPPLTAEERLGGMGGFDTPDDLPEDYTRLPVRKRNMLEDMSARIYRMQREARLQQESFELLSRKFQESEEGLKLIPAISPVPKDYTWKSSPFGRRTDPFTGLPAFHSGIDFAGRQGTPIYATADGMVVYAYEDVRLGKVVVVAHDPAEVGEDGKVVRTQAGIYRTEYGHMEKILVKKGDWVRRGQQIGAMGSTGRSTGPHLHYAVRYQDKRRSRNKGYVDPETFLLDWPKDDRVTGWLSRADE